MGKLNRKPNSLNPNSNQDSSINWDQLLVGYENKSIEEVFKNIMIKMNTAENVEFDQLSLILKHYLLQNDEAFLNHFLQFNQSQYLNDLVERFNSSGQVPNVQWMISELLKLLSSICSNTQANFIISNSQLTKLLFASIFDGNLLNKLKSPTNGLTQTETAILVNLLETISNLCEIKNELLNFVTVTHIQWLSDALINSNHIFYKDLLTAIARIFHLISEFVGSNDTNNNSNNKMIDVLFDKYINNNFFTNCILALNKNCSNNTDLSQSINQELSNNLNAKLYMIVSMINLIISNERHELSLNMRKSEFILKILNDCGAFIEYSLNINLNDDIRKQSGKPSAHETQSESLENDAESLEAKNLMKSIENSIDCKMLSLELIRSITNYFINENENDDNSGSDNEESWDECDSGDETVLDNKGEMDVEMDQQIGISDVNVESKNIDQLKILFKSFKIMDLVIKTAFNDNENMFQDADRIEHIYKSIRLIRIEAVNFYLSLMKNLYAYKKSGPSEIGNSSEITIEHLNYGLQYLANKPIENFESDLNKKSKRKNDLLFRLIELIYDLFGHLNSSFNPNKLNMEQKFAIINLIKGILFKFKASHVDLTARLAKIICLMAIKERDTNFVDGQPILQSCASFLIDITDASFSIENLDEIESLRLNSELLDLIIDLFGEDNLSELEKSLNFLEKLRDFGVKFYIKYKKLGKKQKLLKDQSVIIKTVRDNLKSFIEYKMQNLK